MQEIECDVCGDIFVTDGIMQLCPECAKDKVFDEKMAKKLKDKVCSFCQSKAILFCGWCGDPICAEHEDGRFCPDCNKLEEDGGPC